MVLHIFTWIYIERHQLCDRRVINIPFSIASTLKEGNSIFLDAFNVGSILSLISFNSFVLEKIEASILLIYLSIFETFPTEIVFLIRMYI